MAARMSEISRLSLSDVFFEALEFMI